MAFDAQTARAQTAPGLRIVEAFATNGTGYDRWSGHHPTTFVTYDPEGRNSIGWFNGHSADGDLWEVAHHGVAYRLTVRAERGVAA